MKKNMIVTGQYYTRLLDRLKTVIREQPLGLGKKQVLELCGYRNPDIELPDRQRQKKSCLRNLRIIALFLLLRLIKIKIIFFYSGVFLISI